jgi:thymidylate synthase (FAD)
VSSIEVLDHGYVEAVDFWGSEEGIIEAARMSTQKGFKGWGVEEQCATCDGTGIGEKSRGFGPGSLCPECKGRKRCINKPGDEKLLRFLWENKHSTPFEMAGATFEVQAPIFVFREWHRHRVPFGYSEASARYAPLPDVNYVPSVERLMVNSKTNRQAGTLTGAEELTAEKAEEFRNYLVSTYEECEDLYQDALKNGVPKELARIILPVGRYSKMRATSNLRGWLAFLALRNAPTAQIEIRVYAEAVQKMLAEKFPRTLALFSEKR